MVEVSVIIPAYNLEKYIGECLESLLRQTYTDYEVICIEDCSTDSTYNILQQFSREFFPLKIVRNNKNMGAARSRNKGLELAKGEYVIFLDGDDYFDKDFLLDMHSAAVQQNADMVICRHFSVDRDPESGKEIIRAENQEWELLPSAVIEKKDNFRYLFQVIGHEPWSKLVRRELLVKESIVFQELPNSNDMYFSMMAASCADRIVFLIKELVYYRMYREGAISSIRTKAKNYGMCAFAKIFRDLEKKGYYQGSIKRSLINYVVNSAYYYGIDNETKDLSLLNEYKNLIEGYLLKENLNSIFYTDWGMYQYHCLQGSRMKAENRFYALRRQFLKYAERESGKRFVLWGAGKWGRQFMESLGEQYHYINYIVDRDKLKQGKKLNHVEIVDYGQIEDTADIIILLNPSYWNSVELRVRGKSFIFDYTAVLQYGLKPEECALMVRAGSGK